MLQRHDVGERRGGAGYDRDRTEDRKQEDHRRQRDPTLLTKAPDTKNSADSGMPTKLALWRPKRVQMRSDHAPTVG